MGSTTEGLTEALLLASTKVISSTKDDALGKVGDTLQDDRIPSSHLYYIRHVVTMNSSRTIDCCNKVVPTILPKLKENMEIPSEEWTELWISKVHPIAKQIELYGQLFPLVGIVLSVMSIMSLSMFVFVLVLDTGTRGGHSYDVYFIPLLIRLSQTPLILLVVFRAWRCHVRGSQLQALRYVFCEDEHQFFCAYGYTVECSVDRLKSGKYGFCIYFTPIITSKRMMGTHGTPDEVNEAHNRSIHQRMELFRAGQSCQNYWTPISMVNLSAYGKEEPPFLRGAANQLKLRQLWAEFWSQMLTISGQVLFWHRCYCGTILGYIAVYSLGGEIAMTSTPWNYVAVLVFVGIAIPYFYVRKSQLQLIEKHAAKFAQCGVLIEHRRTLHFGWHGTAVDYLHVIPSIEVGALQHSGEH